MSATELSTHVPPSMQAPLDPLRLLGLLAMSMLALYRVYLWLLPKPMPGIPYNHEAVTSIFGDIPSIVAEVGKTNGLMAWLQKQTERHRAPLVQVFMWPFSKPALLLSDFRESQDILLHRTKDFDRSTFAGDIFGGIAPNFHIVKRTGPEWKAHRRLLQDLMTPSFLDNVAAPSIYDSMLDIVDLWCLKARLADGRPFAAAQDIHNAALDAVLAFSFGKEFSSRATKPQMELLSGSKKREGEAKDKPVTFPQAQLDPSIQSMIDITDVMIHIKSALLPRVKWWFVLMLPHIRRAYQTKDRCIMQELKRSVEASGGNKSSRDDSWVRSAVDHVVSRETRFAEKDGRAPAYFSPVMQDEVFGFVIAGHDTTSTTLSWGVKLLADHPRAQCRLRLALRAAFSASAAERRLPTHAEITKTPVPYLDACIEEMLRLGNTVPAFDRQALRDTVLLGHFIPKGTVVFAMNNGPGMLSPAVDVDEAKRSESARGDEKMRRRPWRNEGIARFQPERWLVGKDGERVGDVVEEEEEKDAWSEAVFDAQAGPAAPFGGGVRGCFGRRLAYLEMRLFLTMVLWQFELLKCPEDVSGYEAYDGVVHKPKKCFVRLRHIKE
ncbi:Cytochrome P450 27C1 [Lasiodiplodia hormozganensis]|uniref:Cytochrome P450 27C1 n=1 Tax=Lasiodiplodia hormozganensis TaxID=869390 RepID=A0AA40CRC3_9PEZI|nr:Cytochrome P450 27C1 [Lasiodiplodia hormozganensis]